MHLPILAGPRRRTRRAVLSKLVISDTAPITALNGCTVNGNGDAECPITAHAVNMHLGDKDDRVEYAAPHQGFVNGLFGNDTFVGGIRRAAPGRSIEPVFYDGSFGTDTVDYQFADRGVRVDTSDNPTRAFSLATDGRPGIDRESVQNDIEHIQGSNFGDTLFGSDANNLFRGRNGDDAIAGRAGADVIDEGSAPDGADTISGGDGPDDRVFYSLRTSGVNVSLDSVRNDGATGEQDNVSTTVEHIGGTNFGDVLIGNGSANVIDGFGGNDTIHGLGANDTLSAGAGTINGVAGGAGNDVIFARNLARDNIDCGTDTDTLDRDTQEGDVQGCEKVQVGVLRLAPKALAAEAGKIARLRLSWRHPQGWRRLRKIELRLTRDRAPVGEMTIRPRDGRISADGAVRLLRKHSRLTHKGKTVTARLAVRLDESLAGQTLQVDVEATDARGARQLERDAGTVRVAR
jgi:hypothetical protein